MPAKRMSIISRLEKDREGEPKQPVAVADEPVSDPASARADIVRRTIHVPTPSYERLREIAYIERCKIQDLFMEAIDKLIEGRGHPERAQQERPKKRK